MADRVSEALRQLRARFGQAEAHVDATQARARKASARRLRELLAGPPAARVAGLHDAALTPADRAELESAVAGALPRRHVRMRRSLTGAGRRLMRHVRYRRRGLIALVLLVTSALSLARTISTHTLGDAVPVRLTAPYTITWTLAGGQVLQMDEAKEAKFVWFQRDGKSYLRRWFDGRGYGEVMVTNAFTRTAITLRF
ncbi:hypothetical protein [Methylobacterium planeticum]|uniref:Uncharacterized protein n=1 Tax=Methylobacterium planeticum TaxID=2615211 RepID=A0A6N6MJD2_9HYPH|nr:hypothetical protein [Methylobacterium planeticum]KAB1070580.1 hypothetical protein F6X51_22200 [Methylobacterium planeticum]